MLPQRTLVIPNGYDRIANPRIASFAGQLDDQLAELKKDIADLEILHLEWQAHPGVNTIGMLLTHLAIAEISWILLRPQETRQSESDRITRTIIGIGTDDDGIPLGRDGLHPKNIAGLTINNYVQMIDSARNRTHHELRQWRDSDLPITYRFRKQAISREWTVYHVLEHFCGHYGQIRLLKHIIHDTGLLRTTPNRTNPESEGSWGANS